MESVVGIHPYFAKHVLHYYVCIWLQSKTTCEIFPIGNRSGKNLEDNLPIRLIVSGRLQILPTIIGVASFKQKPKRNDAHVPLSH